MKIATFSKFTNSVQWKLVAYILLFFLPIVGILICNNYQSRNIFLEQVRNTHQNMLSANLSQLDTQIYNATIFSVEQALYETDPMMATTSPDDAERQYAKIRLMERMTDSKLANELIDGYFILLEDQTGYQSFLFSGSSYVTYEEQELIHNYTVNSFNEGRQQKTYGTREIETVTIDDTLYLIQVASNGKNTCAGAYVNLSKWLTHMEQSTPADSQFLFASSKDLQFIEQSNANQHILTQESAAAPILLVELLPQQKLLQQMPFMQRYFLLVFSLAICAVLALIIYTRHVIVQPLIRLTNAMRKVQSGDLSYRIPDAKALEEFQLTSQAFNEMVKQIQNLRIQVYDEKINTQKAQLRNLQLQIRPHFLINSLNMIYNLLETHNLSVAKSLILYTVDYFKYMMKVDENLVPLNEEIAHVQTYLHIQEIRYNGKFSYTIDVDPMIADMLIPPLLVQTFVENSLKYALRLTEETQIYVRVTSFERDYFPYGCITVSDTGNGYPEKYLDSLNAAKKIDNHSESCIGIMNLMRRLHILFGEKASWKFYNQNGAVSEIILPATFASDTQSDEDNPY